MRLLIISALCAVALPAAADDTVYRCINSDGVLLLTDRPCENQAYAPRPAPVTLTEKEHFALPPSEQGRSRWASKPPASEPPKVDVETLRLAHQALGLRDKVASAR